MRLNAKGTVGSFGGPHRSTSVVSAPEYHAPVL